MSKPMVVEVVVILKNFKCYLLSLVILGLVAIPFSSFAIKTPLNLENSASEPKTIKAIANNAKQSRNAENLYVVILTQPSVATFNAANSTNNYAQLTAKTSNKKKLNIHSKVNQQYREQLISQQQQVLTQLNQKRRSQLKAEHSFQLAVNGFTARLAKADVEQLKSFSKVKTVQKIKAHKLSTNAGPQHINAPKVWQGENGITAFKGEGVIVGIIDTGVSAEHPSFAEIGADNYQHINPLGAGVYLGDCVLSEYQHYCNEKLIGIWSHAEITKFATYPGDDPIGLDVQGHGSHVASTVAGNVVNNVPVYNVIGEISEQTFEQISGVAPHANIVSYQVCDLDGCWPDITALAVEHAIANGVQVINYSIGGEAINPWYSIDALAMLSARDAGIHVATSAGNMGPDESTLGTPGNAPWLTSVAAITHGRSYSEKNIRFSGGFTDIGPFVGQSATSGISAELVDGQEFNNPDCLFNFPANSLTGKVVVCRRGDIPRVEKGSYALSGNAAGMILINKIDGAQSINVDFHVLPTIHLAAIDGQNIIEWLNDGADNHTMSFNGSIITQDQAAANIVADFSSRGPEPVFNQYLAPHVAAPGVNIYAANAEHQPHFYGLNKQPEYAFLDGTSMASPHVAGALALIAGLKPQWSPSEAQSALMLTANSNTKNSNGNIASYFDTGAGSIKIDNAINSALLMDESTENFNNADPSLGGSPLDLNLPALLGENCMLECQWQRTFKATVSGSWKVSSESNDQGLAITASPSGFSLQAGEEITITFSAVITEHYPGGYISGAVKLTTEQQNYSEAVMPVIASFKRGKYPDNIEIIANSNKGSSLIAGVTTVAADNIVANVYNLSEVEKVQFELARDDSDGTIYPFNVFNNEESYYSQAFKIDLDTRYIEVRVTNTSSPDLDLYIGSDWNLNGRPDSSHEMSSLLCASASATAYEKCLIENPPLGNFFIAVHNYGDYQAPSNTVDNIEIEIIKIDGDDQSIAVNYNSQAENFADIDLTIGWDAQMQANKQYVTAIDLGTNIESASDIGFLPIRINRSDKTLSTGATATNLEIGDLIELTVFIDANISDFDKVYTVNLPLADSLVINNSSEEHTIANDTLTWVINMSTLTPAKKLDITLDSSQLALSTTLDLVLNYQLIANNELSSYSEAFNTISLLGIPSALINNEDSLTINVNEGEAVTLSGLTSTNPNIKHELSYFWQQTSGPAISIPESNNAELSFTAPQVMADSSVSVDLTVTSAGKSSTATVIINIANVEEQSSGSGGSFGYYLMLLLAFALLRASLTLSQPLLRHCVAKRNLNASFKST